MRREYEALSKLVGKNFAVLEDGMGVYLTPKGEVRDIEGRLLLPELEGRARLFKRNLEGGGASDAVQYIPQELTESQQMQARKNLNLPYKAKEQIEQVFSNLYWSDNQAMLEGFSLIENKEYTVKYNGETYTAPALFNDEFGVLMVNLFDNGDEVIQIGQMGEECLIMHEIGFGFDSVRGDEVTIRYETEATVTLPPEYLPKGIVLYADAQTNECSCNLPLEKCLEYFNGSFLQRQGGFPNVTLLLVHPLGMPLIIPGLCAKDRYVSEDENKDVSECLLFAFTLPDASGVSVFSIQYSVDGLAVL